MARITPFGHIYGINTLLGSALHYYHYIYGS